MDPVSALGIAGVAVQFIDFSCKVLPKVSKMCRHVKDGSGEEFKDLQLLASKLRNLNSNIEDSINPTSLRRPLSPTEEAIRSTSRECRMLAEELLAALKKAAPTWFGDVIDGSVETMGFARHISKSVWARLRDTLRVTAQAHKIEALQRQLDSLRQQLMMEILVALQ